MDHDVDATTVDEFVRRYAAVWNEPDPDVRRAAIAALWAEDGVEYTENAEHRGHRALEARVTQAHEQLVRDGGFVFRAAGDVVAHHDAVRFTTYMLPATGGEIAWTGFVFVRLDGDGRIRSDHQFSDPPVPEVTKGAPAGTRVVVEEYLRRTRENDPDQIAEMYAAQVDWRVNWPVEDHPAVPWIRPRSTRADVADHYRTFSEHCVPAEGEVELTDFLVDGADALLVGTSSQLVKATGRRFTMAFTLRLTVEDGLITRHHMYEDSLAVAAAFTHEPV